jgi:hypothetical protein
VIGKATQAFSFSAVKRARVLAAFLLASIAWGATAELTHNHGSRARPWLAQTQVTDPFNANKSIESSNQNPLSSRSRSSAECLICQLHQNLSNTLLGQALATATAETHSFAFNPDLALYRADFSRGRRGRAPPVIL